MERVALDSRRLGRTASVLGLAAQALWMLLLCFYVAALASANAIGIELQALFVLVVVASALAVPPHVFIALALLVFGTQSLSEDNPFEVGSSLIYSTDILLLVVLIRALQPRERVRPPAPLDFVAKMLFGAWALVMAVAGLRSALSGYELFSIVRLEAPLIYGASFYFGFGRIIRERGFRFDTALRNLLTVAIAFVGYMILARVTNSPFEGYGPGGGLGTVVTTEGVFRRDYGFASAFIIYPALALAGAAYLIYGGPRKALAATVAGVGALATVLTLIRGEIFGLFVGLAVLVLLPRVTALGRFVRARAIMAASIACVIGGLSLWAIDAPLARGIVERSLPGFVQQTETADSTAAYRREALGVGLAAAERAPAGIGLIPVDGLVDQGIDPGFLGHSGPAALLVYTGWIGLAAAALALVGLVRASFRLPRPIAWLHPFFVGSLLMLVVYSFAANGLVGQGWVIGIAALIAALRFQGGGAAA